MKMFSKQNFLSVKRETYNELNINHNEFFKS